MVEGRSLTLYTDHKPLVRAFSKAADPIAPNQRKHLTIISQYSTDIRYIKGADNAPADAMSRIEDPEDDNDFPPLSAPSQTSSKPISKNTNIANSSSSHTPSQNDRLSSSNNLPVSQYQVAAISLLSSDIDFEKLHNDQMSDQECLTAPTSITSLQLKWIKLQDFDILADTSLGIVRIYLPSSWRFKLFQTIHGLSHPSGRVTLSLMSRAYVWHGMKRDISSWAKCCLDCQKSKVARHCHPPTKPISDPHIMLAHVHLDVVGPLAPSQGYRYILTCIDRTTRWPEAIPIQDATADTLLQTFLLHWVARYGVPLALTTDRAAAFSSNLWTQAMANMGIKIQSTTAYHPQANGCIERFHRGLKAALRCRLDGPSWTKELPWALLGLRTAIRGDDGCSSSQLLYGSSITAPGFLWQSQHDNDNTPQSRQARRDAFFSFMPSDRPLHAKSKAMQFYVPQAFSTCTHVWLRVDKVHNKLQPCYEGPFKVLRMNIPAGICEIDRHGVKDTVTLARLKPAFIQDQISN